MSKIIMTLAIIVLMMTGTFTTGCQSSGQKVDDAKNKVEDAQQDLKAAQQKDAETAMQAANNEEWQIFKTQSEIKIKENDASIEELKEKMKKSGKNVDAILAKNIESLEKKNKDLSSKIDSYDKNRSNWESFKREFNSDMDAFGTAFKDLTINNKK